MERSMKEDKLVPRNQDIIPSNVNRIAGTPSRVTGVCSVVSVCEACPNSECD